MVTTAIVEGAPRTHRIGLSARILIGLLAGIALGLLIGDRAAALQLVADAYIKLLQMTVLPYVTLSLIGGLGGLSLEEAKRLGVRVGLVLVLLWAIALAAVFMFPLMFPRIQAASFFSTTLLDEGTALDLVGLYIPANPFNSLANNVVPAVVLFSALLGIALIRIPGKAATLQIIEVINRAVGAVATYIVALTPYGLFAIAAVLAGTFDPQQARQLEGYLAGYVLMSLVLALWVLPGLVAALTPIPHRAVLARTRNALIVAFSTGSLFVVLPLLTDQARQLLRDYARVEGRDERLPEVIVPASFNFPHTAKVLSLSFVLFAGWFAGTAIAPAQYPVLAATGVMVLFANLNVAIPFLLDLLRIPADTFQLFLASSVVNSRFGTMLSAVHTVAIALIGTCAIIGIVRFNPRRLVRFAVLTLAIMAATVVGTRVFIERVLGEPYDKDQVLANMHSLRDRGAAHVFRTPPPPLPPFAGSVLDRVRTRRLLRVGYFDDSLPYVFTNARRELVGFDVEMAQQLAGDLGVGLELVPVSRTVFQQGLDPSTCDIVMSGVAVTADRTLHVSFSTPYLDETVAFLVPDHRRAEFASWDQLRAAKGLRLGVPRSPYYMKKIRSELPRVEIVPVDEPEQMFGHERRTVDAFVLTAERGSAYTLLHPEYSVVIPQPRPLKVPLAYVIAGRDQPLANVIDTWIELKRQDGTIDELFGHWILGRDATPHRRRWSVLDNVLGRGR